MNEIAALITSLNALSNITQAAIGLRDSVKINEKLAEVLQALVATNLQAMAVQQGYAALETKIRELQAECTRLQDWSAEKQNYACRLIAKGVFAYIHNEITDQFEQAHKYCCNCFDQGQRSLLQQSEELHRTLGLYCPRCRTKLVFNAYIKPSNIHTSVQEVT
jgi:hypothetical protein